MRRESVSRSSSTTKIMPEKKKKKKEKRQIDPALLVGEADVDHLVDVDKKGRGTLRWIGEEDFGGKGPALFCGIEMLAPFNGAGDGTVAGRRFFTCEPGFAIFVPHKKVSKVARKTSASETRHETTALSGQDALAISAAETAQRVLASSPSPGPVDVDLSNIDEEPDWANVRPTAEELADCIREQQETFLATLDGGQQLLLFKKQMNADKKGRGEKWVPEYLKIINDEDAMNKFIDRSKLSKDQLDELDKAEKGAVVIAQERAVARAKREWHQAIAAEQERVQREEQERLEREAAEREAIEAAERAEREAVEAAERAEKERQEREEQERLAKEAKEREIQEAAEHAKREAEEAARREAQRIELEKAEALRAIEEAKATEDRMLKEEKAAKAVEEAKRLEAIRLEERAAHEEEIARVKAEAAQQARIEADLKEAAFERMRQEMLETVKATIAAEREAFAAAKGNEQSNISQNDLAEQKADIDKAKGSLAKDQHNALNDFANKLNKRAEDALDDVDDRIQEAIAGAANENEVKITKMMEKMSGMAAKLETFAKLQTDNKRLTEKVSQMQEKIDDQERRLAKFV